MSLNSRLYLIVLALASLLLASGCVEDPETFQAADGPDGVEGDAGIDASLAGDADDPTDQPDADEIDAQGTDVDDRGDVEESGDAGPMVSCPGTSVFCEDAASGGGACIELSSDPGHCGECHHRCDEGPDNSVPICVDGECDVECESGFTDCDGVCVDLDLDPDHCGECDQNCDDAMVCTPDGCTYECSGDLTECDGVCVDVNSDAGHCGGCASDDPAHSCEAPDNATALCVASECNFVCNGDYSRCGDDCVHFDDDPEHCGSCNHDCPIPDNGSPVCSDGECDIQCENGFERCGDACVAEDSTQQVCGGECVDTATSVEHCGGCDNPCGSGEICDVDQCVGCTEDGQCTQGGMDFCVDDECVECREDEHCGDPDLVACENNVCGDCEDPRSDEEICSDNGVVCGNTLDGCQESVACDSCDGNFDNCKAEASVCVECLDDDHCDGDLAYCDDEGDNLCVECVDDEHCGDPSLYNCEANACVVDDDATICGGEPVDLETNEEHCGACDNACDQGTTGSCDDGHCQSEQTCDAGEPESFGGGEGDSDDPFLICNAEQVQLLSGSSDNLNAHFLLTADIDLDGAQLEPFGDGDAFEGTFDGNHYEITDFKLDLNDQDRSGFFNEIGDDGEVRNLVLSNVDGEEGDKKEVGLVAGRSRGTIENVSVEGSITGDEDVGALVGTCENECTIRDAVAAVVVEGADNVGGLVGTCDDNCSITHSAASGTVTGDEYVGGLVGRCREECHIADSRADGDVIGKERRIGGLVGKLRHSASLARSAATGDVELEDDREAVGGLVGKMRDDSSVAQSYATGNVSAQYADEVGGLIGVLEDGGISVTDSYATGEVTGDKKVGGLIGLVDNDGATVADNYSIGIVSGDEIGGLIGDHDDGETVIASYWWYDVDDDDSQVDSSDGGQPLRTDEFSDNDSFQDWGFGGVWEIESGQGAPVDSRPILWWQ